MCMLWSWFNSSSTNSQKRAWRNMAASVPNQLRSKLQKILLWHCKCQYHPMPITKETQELLKTKTPAAIWLARCLPGNLLQLLSHAKPLPLPWKENWTTTVTATEVYRGTPCPTRAAYLLCSAQITTATTCTYCMLSSLPATATNVSMWLLLLSLLLLLLLMLLPLLVRPLPLLLLALRCAMSITATTCHYYFPDN